MVGVVIYLFFATAIGIFLGTVARSMPQLGLLYMLVYLPMNMLSGSNTPLESMPPWLATVMQASPSTHFVSFAQSILYRGAGLDVVWPHFVLVALIGGLFFGLAFCASAPSPRSRRKRLAMSIPALSAAAISESGRPFSPRLRQRRHTHLQPMENRDLHRVQSQSEDDRADQQPGDDG